MPDINDVRRTLWDAYKKKAATPDGIQGRSSEAWVEVHYPTFWDCKNIEEFLIPWRINIYSYALGPGRIHAITRAEKDRCLNYCTWESPDIFAKAIEIINSWIEAEINDLPSEESKS